MPNIKLKDRNGNDVIYQNILSVTFDTEDGDKVTFYYGTPTQEEVMLKVVGDTVTINNQMINDENNLVLSNAMIKDGCLVLEGSD